MTKLLSSMGVLRPRMALVWCMLAPCVQAEAPWLLAKYDLDGDRRISQQEVAAHKQGVFQYMDHDGDGRVGFIEYERADQARRQSLLKARFAKLDVDHDGVVTAAEYRSYRGLFDSIDSDGDGLLSPGEMGAGSADTYVTRCLLWLCLKTPL